MSILEDIARAAANGGFSAQSFNGPGYESVWAQLKPWLGRITTTGVMKWIPRAASQMPCQVPRFENGMPTGPCEFHALETCLGCSRPICLSHAFLDGQGGNAVCHLCVIKLRDGQPTPQQEPPRQPPPYDQPPQADPLAEAKQKEWWARGVLGVQEGVTWSDVKRQYKSLSRQHHPDRTGGDDSRFKNVQTAYDVLKLIYGEN